MAYTNINKSKEHFNTKLYTGDGADDRNITGVGFQPDLVWLKERSNTSFHLLANAVTGATRHLFSNSNNAEITDNTNRLQAFQSDGFQVGSDGTVNENSETYVAWNWKAGGTASSNTDGSITSSVSTNTTAGFSIVSWTGSGADATVGHGLSSAPTIYIVKNRSDASDWRVAQVLTSSNNMTDGNGYYMELNSTKASTNPGSADTWGATPTAPTSSVFTVGSNNAHNGSGDNMIAYCFHSVQGYSKFGSYTGNGNADGTFVYTGFKPAFVIHKRTDIGASWMMYDNKRQTVNPKDQTLFADLNNVESGGDAVDFLSNGFKQRSTGASQNASGGTYIYMAFAEAPLVGSNNIPTTAI